MQTNRQTISFLCFCYTEYFSFDKNLDSDLLFKWYFSSPAAISLVLRDPCPPPSAKERSRSMDDESLTELGRSERQHSEQGQCQPDDEHSGISDSCILKLEFLHDGKLWLRFRNDRWPINIQNSNSIPLFLVLPVLDFKTMTISVEHTVLKYFIGQYGDIDKLTRVT